MRTVISDLFAMLFLAIFSMIILLASVFMQSVNLARIDKYYFITRDILLKESLINLLASKVPNKPYRVVDSLFGLQNCYAANDPNCLEFFKEDVENIIGNLSAHKIYWGVEINNVEIGHTCEKLAIYLYQFNKPVVKVCYPIFYNETS